MRSGIGVNIADAQKRSPLMIAARLNLTGMIRLLLHYGADPDAADYLGRNALAYAMKYKALEALKILLTEV